MKGSREKPNLTQAEYFKDIVATIREPLLVLAVSRKLAEANGRRIEVVSEPGKGSTFTLWLPAHRPGTIGKILETP
jgi:hypothetical protein